MPWRPLRAGTRAWTPAASCARCPRTASKCTAPAAPRSGGRPSPWPPPPRAPPSPPGHQGEPVPALWQGGPPPRAGGPRCSPPSTAWKKVSCHLGERKATWDATSASAAAACAAWCAAARRASRRHPIAARPRARRRSSVRAVWSGWIRTATAAAMTLSLCSPLSHGGDGLPTPYIILRTVQQAKYALPLWHVPFRDHAFIHHSSTLDSRTLSLHHSCTDG